jgi:hypothetical protein
MSFGEAALQLDSPRAAARGPEMKAIHPSNFPKETKGALTHTCRAVDLGQRPA